jgi:ubiquinol-cytochrome c reductase cytochrome b subunit
MPATDLYTGLARIFTVLYFAFFLLMPWYTKIEKCRPAPSRVTFHA